MFDSFELVFIWFTVKKEDRLFLVKYDKLHSNVVRSVLL